MKIIIIVLIVLIIAGFFIANYYIKKPINSKLKFQGPVRPTDDEEYFRKTGITRPIQNG